MYRDENYYKSRFTFWESVTLAFLAEPRLLVASDACVPSGTTSPLMLVFLAEPHHPPPDACVPSGTTLPCTQPTQATSSNQIVSPVLCN